MNLSNKPRSFYYAIKNFAVRMDYSSPGFWIALVSGGSIAAGISAIHQYSTKEQNEIRLRSIFRDFFIGSFITACIYMFLPESIKPWISAEANTMKIPDVELKMGPARF